jgi:hypothetical protein
MQTTRDEKKKHSVTRYESFSEFMDHVESPVTNGESRNDGRAEWFGTPNFAAAMTLAREGWPEGLERIQKLTARLEHVTGSMVHKPEVQWDVAGDFADAGLFTTGVPECMGSFVESEQVTAGSGKIVRILMNLSASCCVDVETIMRRGAAACALADALETAGRSVEIIMSAATNYGWNVETYVPVKAAGEALEMDRMAFLLAHPSSFRRLIFSAWEHEPEHIRKANEYRTGGSYGYPGSTKDELANIVIPEADAREHRSDEAILKWIGEQLRAQGCEMEGDELLSKN